MRGGEEVEGDRDRDRDEDEVRKPTGPKWGRGGHTW